MIAQTIKDAAGSEFFVFFCPACQCTHAARVRRGAGVKGSLWSWNRSIEKPSIQPMLFFEVNGVQCYSYITDGWIYYFGTAGHGMRGEAVALPELPTALSA